MEALQGGAATRAAPAPPVGRRALLQAPGGAGLAPLAELAQLQPDDLSSPLPFYAALLQPAVAWLLPAAPPGDAAAGQRRQALLQGLAEELAPAVEQVGCGVCCAQLRAARIWQVAAAGWPLPLPNSCPQRAILALPSPAQVLNGTAGLIDQLVADVAAVYVPQGASEAGARGGASRGAGSAGGRLPLGSPAGARCALMSPLPAALSFLPPRLPGWPLQKPGRPCKTPRCRPRLTPS